MELKAVPGIADMFVLRATEPVNGYYSVGDVQAKTVGNTFIIRPLLLHQTGKPVEGSTLTHEQDPERGWCFVYTFKISRDTEVIAVGEEDDVIWTRKAGFLWTPHPASVPATMVP